VLHCAPAGEGMIMDDGVRRSRRTRYRPLEYWRNEKKNYNRKFKCGWLPAAVVCRPAAWVVLHLRIYALWHVYPPAAPQQLPSSCTPIFDARLQGLTPRTACLAVQQHLCEV
jgi:hypothetical protein